MNVASFYRLLHQDFPSPKERVSWLINEGFIIRRDDGFYDITYLGALCIGASFSLFPPLYGKGVEVVTYSGTSRVSETSIPTFFESGFLLNFDSIVDCILNAMGSKEIVATGLRNSFNPIPPSSSVRCCPTRLSIRIFPKTAVGSSWNASRIGWRCTTTATSASTSTGSSIMSPGRRTATSSNCFPAFGLRRPWDGFRQNRSRDR